MKKNSLRAIAKTLLITFGASVVCPYEILAQNGAEDPKGYLMLITRHVGLDVRIDQQSAGKTGSAIFELSEGLHKVAVDHPDRVNWFEEDWFADVRILANDTLRVPVVFKKSFSINTRPYNATVVKGAEEIGETPIFFKLSENEVITITLSKTGYHDTTFAIGHDQQRFYKIDLAAAKAPINLTLSTVDGDKHSSRSKTILYSTAALAILSGALSFYFKTRGDDKYDDYRNTGDPALLEKYYDDAKRYDRIAAISFGVFQVSFVASFYLLLKEANREKQREPQRLRFAN